ncbi:MAG: hypothetical protein H7039_08535 [Bryobacteraceae bacterium]|nr:hypothetical protein [Bryobacteraceae bacterium]
MRFASLMLLCLSCNGATVTAPFVEVLFGGSGTIPRPSGLNGDTDSSFAFASYESGLGVASAYDLSAFASFGQLGVRSRQSGSLSPGNSLSLNSFATLVDRIVVTSPNSAATSYRWKPTVRITGQFDWTVSAGSLQGLDPAAFWPVVLAVAQYTRVEGQMNFTRVSLPDIFPARGAFDQTVVLPEIVVPANEIFNYRLLLGTVSRLRTSPDSSFQINYALSDLSNTLEVTGLSVLDESGQDLPFRVLSDSGTIYTTAGITAAPEPGTIVTALSALGLVVLARKLRPTAS